MNLIPDGWSEVASIGDVTFYCAEHGAIEIATRDGRLIGDLTARMQGAGGTAYRFDQRPMPMPHHVIDREAGRHWIASEDRL
jgi:hypothetical protein